MSNAHLEGRDASSGRATEHAPRHTALDWIMLAIATLVFVALASMARTPEVPFNAHAAAVLFAVILVILAVCGATLWRITRFS